MWVEKWGLIGVHGHHFCRNHHTLASSVRLSCFHIAFSVLIWKHNLSIQTCFNHNPNTVLQILTFQSFQFTSRKTGRHHKFKLFFSTNIQLFQFHHFYCIKNTIITAMSKKSIFFVLILNELYFIN